MFSYLHMLQPISKKHRLSWNGRVFAENERHATKIWFVPTEIGFLCFCEIGPWVRVAHIISGGNCFDYLNFAKYYGVYLPPVSDSSYKYGHYLFQLHIKTGDDWRLCDCSIYTRIGNYFYFTLFHKKFTGFNRTADNNYSSWLLMKQNQVIQ